MVTCLDIRWSDKRILCLWCFPASLNKVSEHFLRYFVFVGQHEWWSSVVASVRLNHLAAILPLLLTTWLTEKADLVIKKKSHRSEICCIAALSCSRFNQMCDCKTKAVLCYSYLCSFLGGGGGGLGSWLVAPFPGASGSDEPPCNGCFAGMLPLCLPSASAPLPLVSPW